MAAKNKISIFTIVADLAVAYVQRINDLLHLAALEAQLALKTLVMLGVLIFVLASVLTITWLSILALLFVYLVSLHYTLLSACAIVVLVNFITMGLIFFIITRIKANLFFPETLHQLNYKNHKTAIKHESITN